jgi:hypothetical protein
MSCVNLVFEELVEKSATMHELHSVLEAYSELSAVAEDDRQNGRDAKPRLNLGNLGELPPVTLLALAQGLCSIVLLLASTISSRYRELVRKIVFFKSEVSNAERKRKNTSF